MVVVDHHAVTHLRHVAWHSGTDGGDDARRLVAADEAARQRQAGIMCGTVGMQVAAAQTRGLDLDHHLADARRRVVDVDEGEPLLAEEDQSAQAPYSFVNFRSAATLAMSAYSLVSMSLNSRGVV